MLEIEKFRPKLHFSPAKGWMNDPNGMIVIDGRFHLFFQHDPDSTTHGPMHWGHASSTDLVNWTEHPVALYPTELGTCFSGSAVETETGEVKLLYTAHRVLADGAEHQAQCLVHADRELTTFNLDADNPVIENPGLPAFRDPKVIWHEPTGRWILLVTRGQSMGLYGSEDLKTWRFLSEFGEGEGRHSDEPWECPDLIPLEARDGSTVWLLYASLNPGGYAPGSGIQYFLGDFDGTSFSNRNAPAVELWVDYGRDYYAVQTFFDRLGGPPTALAWSSNWLYAKQTPTRSFRGSASLPRELRLVETAEGLRLATKVPASVDAIFKSRRDERTLRFDADIDLGVGESVGITIFGESEPPLLISRASETKGIIRTRRQDMPGLNRFGHDYEVEIMWPSRPLDVVIYVDHGLVEFSAFDGLYWITNLLFPEDLTVDIKVMPIR